MHVLLINGSSRTNGNTYTALRVVADILEAEGITTEIYQVGSKAIRECVGCYGCVGKNACVFNDDCVNELIAKAAECDGFVFGSPVYYAHPSARLLALLDRVFFAGGRTFAHKPGFAVAVARRGGASATLDAIMKHFTISQMPIVPSTYWTMIHGFTPEEVLQDGEGMQTMRNAARNMAWMLKCIQLGKENGIEPPQAERGARTNFIR